MGKDIRENLRKNTKTEKEAVVDQAKEMRRLAREAELRSGVHRYNAAGVMPDKKKEKNKKAARGKYRGDY